MDLLLYIPIFFLIGLGIGWYLASLKAKVKLKEGALERQALTEKFAMLEKMQTSFHEQFKGISSDALKQNNEAFMQMAEQSMEKRHLALGQLIQPVKESLEKFDTKIRDLEKARTGAYAGLKEQVHNLMETQKHLHKETSNLAKALRAPPVRGRWGEIQLKRVVEMAGMVDHCDFFEQKTVSSEERRYRPDLLVKLPGEKNIIVDAKAPLTAFLEAIECQDEERKRLKMVEHAAQIRSHVSQLSKKAYWEQFQPSPEFVVLFLPGETFFSAALEHDPSLIEIAMDQKVILATPTTLIALLRSAAYGWRQESLSQNAELVSKLGKELYKRIVDMSGHWDKVGRGLSNAVKSYNSAVGSLESRVLVSARKFTDLVGGDDLEVLEPIETMPRDLKEQKALDNTPSDAPLHS